MGRDFHIVIRTFGYDIEDLMEEMNHFCHGTHFLYPDTKFNGEDGSVKRTISEDAWGKFTRTKESDTLHMKNGDVFHGAADIYEYILKVCSSRSGSVAIQDDWPWWAAHGEADTAGKIHIVPTHKEDEHHIFFDDNVELDRAHIIDTRDMKTGDPIPFDEAHDVYIVAVNTMEVIENQDYFLERIKVCEEKRASKDSS